MRSSNQDSEGKIWDCKGLAEKVCSIMPDACEPPELLFMEADLPTQETSPQIVVQLKYQINHASLPAVQEVFQEKSYVQRGLSDKMVS